MMFKFFRKLSTRTPRIILVCDSQNSSHKPLSHVIIIIVIALCTCLPSQSVQANWSLNLGYQNPMNSNIGVNFLYFWSQWAFEAGIGNVNTTNNNQNNTTQLNVSGDIDFKYLWGARLFRPYVQFGLGSGAAAGGAGASASLSNPFAGLGLFLKGNDLYFYLSGNLSGNTSFAQAGIGFMF